MGVVYLAEHDRLGRRVALKLLAPDMASVAEIRRRFVDREPRLAAMVEHPNVLPIYDAGEERDGTLWMAMRWVDGPNLGRLLRAHGPLAPERALHLLRQAASALDAAHAKGLIHRDVKPENILVEGMPPDEHVYLTDFGLTRRISSGRFTGSGVFLGSVHYAAPEVIAGRSDLDGRTDVYSLGCVLFQCLTGEVPFPQPSDIAALYSHLNAEPPEPTNWRPELPSRLNDVVRTAMAKVPEDRYPSCGALIEAAVAAATEKRPAGPSPVRTDTAQRDSEAEAPTVLLDRGATSTILIPEETAPGRAVSIQLIPLQSKGRRSARHRIRIENRTGPAVRVHLEAEGGTRGVPEVAPDSPVVAPGSVSWAGVWVRPARTRALLRRRLPFRILARPEGTNPVTLDGVMVRPVPILAWTVMAAVVLGLVGGGAFALSRGRETLVTGGGPSPTPSNGVSAARTRCPLTGARPPSGEVPDRSALAVKVDNQNTPEVRPQRGLFRADLVFEEPIEGALTRLVAIFNCSMPNIVGPVRGPRPTDPDLLAEIGRPLFAFADDQFATPLDMNGVVDVSNRVEQNGYSRTGLEAPFNLFALPSRLLATSTSKPPRAIFTYSRHPPPGSPPGTEVTVPFENLIWRWDPGRQVYLRYYGDQPHTSDGRDLSAVNVILQYVHITHVSIAGESLVKAETVGRGGITVFRNGRMIVGTWRRMALSRPPVFRDRQGRRIALAPGSTWVELIPSTA
jgi:serine/threonine protein kinase